jgi:polynucleotide 5'-kinase involved in rRNA processing
MLNLHCLALDNHTSIHIPQEWQRFAPASLKGTVMVIGRSDTGKTTLARYLFHQLCRHYGKVGFLDCDVGQSTLGLPTTMTLALSATAEESNFPARGEAFSYFIGSTSQALEDRALAALGFGEPGQRPRTGTHPLAMAA